MFVQTVSYLPANDGRLFTGRAESTAQFLSHSKALALQQSITRTVPVLHVIDSKQVAISHW